MREVAAFLVIGMMLGGAGCAAAPAPAGGPAAEAWSPAAVEGGALLLRLEDRRELDADAIAVAAASEASLVRERAALAAGRIGGELAAGLVRPLLEDADSAVAAAAAFALGQLRDTASVAPLAALVDSAPARRVPTVALEAAAALGKIATQEARTALATFLLAADSATPPAVVQEALIASWRAGEEDPAAATRWAGAPDVETRWRAVYALSRRPIPAAVPVLIERLNDDDPTVRAFALRGLSRANVADSPVAPAAVVPHLLAALADTGYAPGIEAINALGGYAEPVVRDSLVSVVARGEMHQRIAALGALAAMGDSAASALPSLRSLALRATEPPHLRATAYEAVARISPDDAGEMHGALAADPAWRVRAAVGRAALAAGDMPAELIVALARDADPRVGRATLSSCGDRESSELEPLANLFIELHAAPDPYLRAAAITCLGRIADATTFPLLLDAFGTARFDRPNAAALAAIDALAALDRLPGVTPHRAFFTRFPRPDDYLLRRRATERFGETAAAAWGGVRPIETGVVETSYEDAVVQWLAPPGDERPGVEIVTSIGRLVLELFPDRAPLTVQNFLLLAEVGYFDGQEWPRVVPNFVVQGGDPRGDTSGGPGYSIRDEPNRERYATGAVGMAHAGPDTAGSQFFITHSPQPHLDGGYTVFGRLVEGEDVLRRLLPGHMIVNVRLIESTDVDV